MSQKIRIKLKSYDYSLVSEFTGFFEYVNFKPFNSNVLNLTRSEYVGKICANADLVPLIRYYPVELAYALALIGTDDFHSITPPWLLRNYPKIENIFKYLRNTPCREGCEYCKDALNIHRELKRIFGHDSFRDRKSTRLNSSHTS